MLEYWHWASTTNSFETYWRGLLSQDYKPNPTFLEAATIGADLQRLGPKLVNLRKRNDIAVYVSNNAQTPDECGGRFRRSLDDRSFRMAFVRLERNPRRMPVALSASSAG
jgi:hypothetical protein